ncbi:MAG: Thiamine biosynthesis lipoprotein ApbE precursor, partial [Verrucomicrobiota bacterium]
MSLERPKAVAVRLWRLVALGLAAGLLRWAAPPPAPPPGATSLSEVRSYLPGAHGLQAAGDAGEVVLEEGGGVLGRVVTTAPQTNAIVGYSGPNNLRLFLGARDEVVGVRLLSSGDTASHVEALREHRPFWESFVGWRAGSGTPPKVEALAGSTLTSLAMAESVVARLSGQRVSLRFPEPLSVAEVQALFPAAGGMREDSVRKGWVEALGGSGETLGYVLRTSPESDDVSGYAGPTECLVGVATDRERVTGIRIRKSYDTEEYVDRVREDGEYAKLLARYGVSQWAGLKFEAEKIEGVAGATQTSFAMAEGVKRRLSQESGRVQGRAGPKAEGGSAIWREWKHRGRDA